MGLLPSSILATALCVAPILFLWLVILLVIVFQSGWKATLETFGQTLWIILGLSGMIFVIMLGFYVIPLYVREALWIVFLGIMSILAFTTLIFSLSSLFNFITARPLVFDTANAKRGFVSIGKCKLRLERLFLSPIWIFLGYLKLADHNLDPKDYLYAAISVSIAIHNIAIAFDRFQIRENGIMSSTGQLVKWRQIVHYSWANNRSEMVLTLSTTRRLPFLKTVEMQFRREVYQIVREILREYMKKRDFAALAANPPGHSIMGGYETRMR